MFIFAFESAIADLVGWVEVTKPNIAFISYLNFLGFTSFNLTYILFHTHISDETQHCLYFLP
ncbi:hypothetical protein MICAC_3470003 [Microcystis aeruginosa PCC 9443]|uniref:Uncharacterized protein n=1 Tax=Microcystis aeruginosa PCC 9443 TaxID=1160281 RepID=I4G3N6_MICAE|nr:hypothetical protein MICAC_3470003 [Microcystis aeruginosa PCC 9443]